MTPTAMLTDAPRPRQPWLGMWYRPRQTLREIIAYNPNYGVAALAVLVGIGRALERASAQAAGDRVAPGTLAGLIVVGGAISGPIVVVVLAYLYHWVGRWLGGRATGAEVRAAVAWSTVPALWGLLLWVPQLLLFGAEMFRSETPILDSSPALAWVGLGLSLLSLGAGLWSVVVLVVCLAEAHRFSVWRGLWTLVLGSLVVVGLALAVGLCVLVFDASLRAAPL